MFDVCIVLLHVIFLLFCIDFRYVYLFQLFFFFFFLAQKFLAKGSSVAWKVGETLELLNGKYPIRLELLAREPTPDPDLAASIGSELRTNMSATRLLGARGWPMLVSHPPAPHQLSSPSPNSSKGTSSQRSMTQLRRATSGAGEASVEEAMTQVMPRDECDDDNGEDGKPDKKASAGEDEEERDEEALETMFPFSRVFPTIETPPMHIRTFSSFSFFFFSRSPPFPSFVYIYRYFIFFPVW
jgi:hypothetical protein